MRLSLTRSGFSRFLQQPLQRPRHACESGRNRWRRLQRHVRSTEIVPRREQSEHRFVILPLLRERIRQPRESTVLHSNRQIVPLNEVLATEPPIYPALAVSRSSWDIHFHLKRLRDIAIHLENARNDFKDRTRSGIDGSDRQQGTVA